MSTPWYQKLGVFGRKALTEVEANADEAEGQNAKGLTHWTTRSRPEELSLAVDCFRKAAALGHAGAQNNLATMLAGGQGAPRDAEEAESWFLRSASQGDASAQFNLAARYHRANVRGLTPDASEGRIRALMWFILSAAQGYRRADEWCERLRVDMTLEEVNKATRRAAEFVPSKENTTTIEGAANQE